MEGYLRSVMGCLVHQELIRVSHLQEYLQVVVVDPYINRVDQIQTKRQRYRT